MLQLPAQVVGVLRPTAGVAVLEMSSKAHSLTLMNLGARSQV